MLNSRLGYPFFSSNLNHETKFSWEIVNTSAKWVNELVLHTGNFAVGSSFSIGLVDYRRGSKKRSWRKKQWKQTKRNFLSLETIERENWLVSSRERKEITLAYREIIQNYPQNLLPRLKTQDKIPYQKKKDKFVRTIDHFARNISRMN